MISIIIPTRNEEKHLAATIMSIRTGLTLEHEIIVSDGNSTDRTLEIAHRLADKVVVHDGPDQNISKNRNNGAKVAAGDLLIFIDSGCKIVESDAFFKQAVSHFEDPKIIALTISYKALPEVERLSDKIIYGYINLQYAVMNNILHKGIAVGKFQMMRKDAFMSLGGYREDLPTCEDLDMFVRLGKIGRTKMDMNLIIYHENRRVLKLGWPRLLWIWTINGMWYTFRNKSFSKEWKVIR